MKPSLETEIAGIKLKNPTVLASGIMSHTGALLKKVANSGAGAVTTKSISLEPMKGHKPPTVVKLEDGLMNAMGLPNPGVDAFLKEIEIAREGKVPIIVSVVGKSVEEFVKVSEKFGDLPDVIELNLSCPNVEGGMAFSQDKEVAAEIVKKVKKVTKAPVIPKLSPNVSNMGEIAKACEKAGADAICAINTMPALAIDINTGKPILTNKTGGLSGTALKPIAIYSVYKIAQNVKIPIIGTGGVSTGEDAAGMLMAGASAIGIGTAVWLNGLGTFKKVCKELEQFMVRKNFKTIKDLKGVALRS